VSERSATRQRAGRDVGLARLRRLAGGSGSDASIAFGLALTAVMASGHSICAVAAPDPIPTFTEARAAFATSEAQLFDRHGVLMATQRADPKARRLAWVALADVSPVLVSTLVAAEDKRFYKHHGVDWLGFAGAAWDSLGRAVDGRGARGASTLTMQLAGLIDPELALTGSARTLGQKWNQAQAALALERTWTKPQVLEAYLNLTSYRGELSGIDAAARALFGKAPAGLDARDAAILVALQRGPNAPAPTVAQRACAVAAIAAPELSCEDVRASAMIALSGAYRLPQRDNLAPHLATRLLKTPGARVTTTLDADLQRYAIGVLRDHLAELADRGVADGAIVVLDNASGGVLAWVGSSGELSTAAQVDGVIALRQAGSTLKPFLYAQAIDSGLLTAASLADDSPIAIATERGAYIPQNYDRSFRGIVSVRTALASSLNVPAVRTIELLGVDRFYDTLRQLGLQSLTEPADYYGASLALGAADVALLTLANAYRTLANGGVWSATHVIAPPDATALRSDEADQHRVYGTPAAFIVSDILSDRAARATSFGLENALATRVWSAVKTGTSKDMRDNWCVGYTSRYTVGVWVGNFSGAPMKDVSGVTGAAPIWRDLVHRLHAEVPSTRPNAPAGALRRRVAFDPAVEDERFEWFLRGTEVALVRGNSADPQSIGATPTIRYPAPDTIIALDPDIPAARERVTFSASASLPGLRWRIDADVLPADRGRADWKPVRGRHTLLLEDAQGNVLSSVGFEVR
jgi:penicillin-binding protein 1C